MMDYVISVGGSLIVPYEVDVEFLKSLRKIVLDSQTRFILVCGGGRTARFYQEAAQQVSKTCADDLDNIGIAATRLNAELVRGIFGNQAFEKVVDDPFEKVDFSKILVCSGWKPGRSTDYVAVQMAKNYDCGTVVNLSNVAYVYDKDPKKHKDAKAYEKLSYEDMKKIVGTEWKPGMNAPFDPVAVKLAFEEKKKVIITNTLNNLKNIIAGEPFEGTTIGSFIQKID